MSELEALSNKELRQKCIEYGMPNVPVTDSSRKILIRRLEAVMSGKPITKTPSKSNRRETMHVSKPSEVASSPKVTVKNNANAAKPVTPSSRASRRTIAVAERHVTTTTTVSEPEYSDVSPDRFETEQVSTKRKTPEKLPTLYPKLPAKEPSPKPILSKTGVVTTSYVQETVPVNEIYAEPDNDDEHLPEEDYIIEEEKSVLKNYSNAQSYNYVPISEPKVSTTDPLASTLSSSTRYSSLESYNYSKPTTTLTSTNVRKSYIPSTTSTYSKPSIASQYARSYEHEFADEYEDDEDDVVVVEDSPIKDAETPYLSQFARNLENLKATPIRHSVGPTKITPPKSVLRNREHVFDRRTIASPLSNINPRRTLRSSQGEGDSSFRQFMLALDEKYHLKHSLILISIFILAVFIYVFFIQSV